MSRWAVGRLQHWWVRSDCSRSFAEIRMFLKTSVTMNWWQTPFWFQCRLSASHHVCVSCDRVCVRGKTVRWCVQARQQCMSVSSSVRACVCVCVCVCVSGCACVESECDAWVMSGDTSSLSMRSMSPTSQSDSSDLSPTAHVTRDGLFQVKIIKVCFLSNSSNLGKNFKLVRCEEGWTVRVCSFLLYYATLLCYAILYCTFLYYAILYYTNNTRGSCGPGVERASCYRKFAGTIPMVCLRKCPRARCWTPGSSWHAPCSTAMPSVQYVWSTVMYKWLYFTILYLIELCNNVP